MGYFITGVVCFVVGLLFGIAACASAIEESAIEESAIEKETKK